MKPKEVSKGIRAYMTLAAQLPPIRGDTALWALWYTHGPGLTFYFDSMDPARRLSRIEVCEEIVEHLHSVSTSDVEANECMCKLLANALAVEFCRPSWFTRLWRAVVGYLRGVVGYLIGGGK